MEEAQQDPEEKHNRILGSSSVAHNDESDEMAQQEHQQDDASNSSQEIEMDREELGESDQDIQVEEAMYDSAVQVGSAPDFLAAPPIPEDEVEASSSTRWVDSCVYSMCTLCVQLCTACVHLCTACVQSVYSVCTCTCVGLH